MSGRVSPGFDEIMRALDRLADPAVKNGQVHYGIQPDNSLGIRIPLLRELVKGVRDHDLALQLWKTGVHEARILASLVDDPRQVTLKQMECWVQDLDSLDVCDQACNNLFVRTPFAVDCALAWMEREEEYIRRAGFVLVACLAVHARKMKDDEFLQFFPRMVSHATDERNFVRKAVNWALRGVGKRSLYLCRVALNVADEIETLNTPTARWIASDARHELERKLPGMN
jgi:3-methyladenine DNA glycosylase AlkD